MRPERRLIGDTIQITWVDSGVTPSGITAAIYNGSDTLINSETMTSSGNGHYFADYTIPNTPGFYVAETIATINSKPYKNRVFFKAVEEDAD